MSGAPAASALGSGRRGDGTVHHPARESARHEPGAGRVLEARERRFRAHRPGVGARAPRSRRRPSGPSRRRGPPPCCKAHDAVLVAHFYVDGDIQDLALETGGCVADSLEMARFGRDHPAQTLVVAGVRFMGETAKILSPEKRVLMPDLDATCSLDLGCPPDEFAAFCDANPDRTVVVYANTSAAVKARADWMVTSSCALAIVRAPRRCRREDPVGARSAPRRLHRARDRRGHADVERRLHRPRGVQGHRARSSSARSTPTRWSSSTPNRPRASWPRPTSSARRPSS